jgi:hypothetical protein
MLLLFPFLAWIAALASVVLLILLWMFGEVGRRSLLPLPGGFVVAAYAQFGANSVLVNRVGLVLQTILAIYLVFRLRLRR